MKPAHLLALSLCLAGVARADPAATYLARCASCHGPDGKGDTAMGRKLGAKDLTSLKVSAAYMEKDIANGEGKMPAFKGQLSADEIKALVKYIQGGLK
jgi:cytochrome c6